MMLGLYIILQLFSEVFKPADQLLGIMVDRLNHCIPIAGCRVGFAP